MIKILGELVEIVLGGFLFGSAICLFHYVIPKINRLEERISQLETELSKRPEVQR